jgi:hypothetical protein
MRLSVMNDRKDVDRGGADRFPERFRGVYGLGLGDVDCQGAANERMVA